MGTVRIYVCKCGEDFFEDDGACVNCGTSIEKAKLIDEPLIKIVSQGPVKLVSADELASLKSLAIAKQRGE